MQTTLLSFGVLILGVWVLGAIAVVLHRLSLRYGVGLLLMYIAVLAGMLAYADPVRAFVEPLPGIILTLPADLLVAVILMIVLLLYIYNGTNVAQAVIFGVALIQLLVALVFMMVTLSAQFPTQAQQVALTEFISVDGRRLLSGTFAFLVDMLVVAVVYQWVTNRFPQRLILSITLALLAALWTDAIIFNLLAEAGSSDLFVFLPGDLLSKTIMGLVLVPLIWAYALTGGQPWEARQKSPNRDALDIFDNMFGEWQFRLFQLDAELRAQEINTNTLINQIHEVFWIADANAESAHFISPAFETVTGLSRGQFYLDPTSVDSRIHPQDQASIVGRWLRYEPTPQERIFRLIQPDGGEVWLRDRTYPVIDEKLGIHRVIGVTEDITAVKTSEALVSAIAGEKQKIRLLDNLIREVSHDVMSPLNSLDLKVYLMEQSQSDP
ncbi:MAG: PAS domain-containing protein, partial [Chloroflexota bacterium]